MGLDSRLQVSAETVHTLADNGLIGADTHAAALHKIGAIPSVKSWRRAIDVALLVLGVGFLLAGIFFFFAYNWQSLPKFGKLAIVEVLIVLAAAIAFWRGLDDIVGRAGLSAAAILVGALLAVYGQVYQTGADSYELFLWWALLTLGWVIIGRFAPLWLGWIGLAQFAIGSMWAELLDANYALLFALLFAINLAILLFWERNFQRGVAAYQYRYWPRVVLTAAMGFVLLPTVALILDDFSIRDEPFMPLLALLYVIYTAGLMYVYRKQIRDLLPLTVAGLGIIIITFTFIGQLFEFDNAIVLILLGLVVLGQATLLVRWLQGVANSWEEGEADELG